MAKDVYLRCLDDTITRLHYIDFVSENYISKLYADDRHNHEYREKIKDMRDKVVKFHDELLDFYINVYIHDQKHPSSYNPLCKKPRKGVIPVTFENYPEKIGTTK